MCKGCKKEYKCPICDKVCKTHRGLEMHIEAHERKGEKIPIKEEVVVEIEEKIEEVKIEEPKVRDYDQEIYNFFTALDGRVSACRTEIDRMFEWYRHIYPKSKIQYNYTCSSCVTHCYKRLKQRYDSIKNKYNNNDK